MKWVTSNNVICCFQGIKSQFTLNNIFCVFPFFNFYDLRSDQTTVVKYPRHRDCPIYNSLPSLPQKAVFCEILTVFANFPMKYTYHWSYSEYLTFLIIFSQCTSRNLHLPLSLRTSEKLQIKTLSFLVSPTHTHCVRISFIWRC